LCTYEDLRDAEDALHYEGNVRCHGRELDVQYAEGDRKSEFPGMKHFSVCNHMLVFQLLLCVDVNLCCILNLSTLVKTKCNIKLNVH